MKVKAVIYTIGHGNLPESTFKDLMAGAQIELLVDVRSTPSSGYAPYANLRDLPWVLKPVGAAYEFMGDSLGGKPQDRSLYHADGKPDYSKMREHSRFRGGLDRLVKRASRRRTAMLCSEEDPSVCHRLLMIGPALEGRGWELRHIRGDGQVQSNGELQRRDRYAREFQGRLGL